MMSPRDAPNRVILSSSSIPSAVTCTAAASTMPASALADNAITAQGTLSGDPTHHESE
jgi:hypothetical protein